MTPLNHEWTPRRERFKQPALKRVKAIARTVSEAAQISAVLVGALFVIHLLNLIVQLRLNNFGIQPRTPFGLVGLIFSPFLHASAGHITANASALLVLLFLLFLNRKYRAEETLLLIWFGSGVGTWLIGRGGAMHIGASSIIYGLIVYLLAAGWWMKGWRPVVAALFVLIFYAGALGGIVPTREAVSWEGHLSGAIVGLLVAMRHHA